jgi:hypothetical protein
MGTPRGGNGELRGVGDTGVEDEVEEGSHGDHVRRSRSGRFVSPLVLDPNRHWRCRRPGLRGRAGGGNAVCSDAGRTCRSSQGAYPTAGPICHGARYGSGRTSLKPFGGTRRMKRTPAPATAVPRRIGTEPSVAPGRRSPRASSGAGRQFSAMIRWKLSCDSAKQHWIGQTAWARLPRCSEDRRAPVLQAPLGDRRKRGTVDGKGIARFPRETTARKDTLSSESDRAPADGDRAQPTFSEETRWFDGRRHS